jgi:plastocyanin
VRTPYPHVRPQEKGVILKRFIVLLIAAFTVVATILVQAQARTTATVLTGQSGPGFTIWVKKSNKIVKTVKAGRFTLMVNDRSTIHNFRLRGPGINRATSLGFVGRRTWSVTLRRGTYTIVCDPHAAMGMKTTLRVT